MNLHFSFKAEQAKNPDVESDLQQHAQKLGKFLTAYRPDLIHLHGSIDHKARTGYSVSLNLRLPTGQMAAQEQGPTLQPAIKVAFAELTSQLKRHKQLIRNEHRWRRTRRRGRGPVTELQETVEQVVSGESKPQPRKPVASSGNHDGLIGADAFNSASLFQSDVRQFISGNLKRLQNFVERELRFREDNGELAANAVSADEVMDEVVVSALSTEQAPDGIATERWIYRLALDAIQRLASENADGESDVHFEEPVGTPNVQATDEELLQYRQPGESHNREDFLNTGVTNPEDAAAQDEMVEQLEAALRGARVEERHAFVLYTIEGFTLPEIARVMERQDEQVKRLIQSAREQVIKRLPPSNALKRRLLEHSDVA